MDILELQKELKGNIDEFNTTHAEFVKSNDSRLEKIEKGIAVGSDREEKVNKMAEALTGIEEKLVKFQTALDRPGVSADDKKAEQDEMLKVSRKAMSDFMRHGKSISLSPEALKAYEFEFENCEKAEAYKALSVGSNTDGGYYVRPAISSQITSKVFESSPMRELADIESISTDAFEELYDDDEPGSANVSESGTRTETTTNKIKMVRFPTHEMYAYPKLTQKIIDDSGIDIEAWHSRKVSEKFARDEATDFIAGNGVNESRGITTYAAGDGFELIEQVNSGSAGAVTADGLFSLQGALLEPFQNGATWLMARATWTAIRKLKDANNQYLLPSIGGLLAGVPMELLGNPVRMAADMPAIAGNSLSLAYGDFRQGYLIVDRIGIRVVRDNVTTPGQVKLNTSKRVGGGVRQFQAIKLQKLAV